MATIYLSGVGWGGWLYSDYNASLSSNWTELDWTGTELGKIMTFIVATNVIANRPPERRRTGTPHARANRRKEEGMLILLAA